MALDYDVTYDSVADLMRVAGPLVSDGTYPDGNMSPKFIGAKGWTEVKRLAVDGWDKEADAAVTLAESAIETIEQEHPLPAFSAYWDVSGSEVDVARYLSGEPENMIDYEMVPTPRTGRVIVLCSSVSFSGAVSADAIKRRGYMVTALAFALTRMGYAVELWADLTARANGKRARMRVLVKGPNDELDPARIMFAYAHPAMLRALCMPTMHKFPESIRKTFVYSGYGSPVDPIEDMSDGTIYLPSVCSSADVPDADQDLLRHMRDLGIVTD